MLERDFSQGLEDRLNRRAATVGVIGLGYVGLPLAAAAARAGFATTGFDVDPAKTDALAGGRSYIDAVSSGEVAEHIAAGRFQATTQFEGLGACDVIVICVPTPLTAHREPDLTYIDTTAQTIAAHLRPGQLVVLESTSYPGTTEDVLKPLLESSGLRSGRHFWLGFSPEREDPGNKTFHTTNIPKVVAGDGAVALGLVSAFYGALVNQIIATSSPRVAEAVKLTENVFRAVNIALVNELKLIYDAMGVDVWEVIDAAATKPFGYMPFYPGPGLGGHCIPIDPFYLTWKAREHGLATRFIELAGEINVAMPRHVIARLAEALDRRDSTPLSRAAVLIVGLAYKKNVGDTRESPALKLMELLEDRGAQVEFHDPHLDEIPPTRAHPGFTGRRSMRLEPAAVARFDAVLIVTDHDAVDYPLISQHARLIVDTRNAMRRRGLPFHNVVLS
jgi:UDP-N-acetyl-D-glucosamine dehydrogenase